MSEKECMPIEECLEVLKKFVATIKRSYNNDLGDSISKAEEALDALPTSIQELKNLSKIGDVYGPCQDQVSKLFS